MEKFYSLVSEANKSFKTADHLAYMTYPVVNEKKLLITILENIQLSLSKAMEAFLYYDALFKRISRVPASTIERLHVFRNYTARRYSLHPNIAQVISEINEIISLHRESAMEFARKERYFIATSDFRLRSLTIEKIKNYLNETKLLILKLNGVLEESDRRFGRKR